MKISQEEIVQIVNDLSEALVRSKEALRVSKKVYGSDSEISAQLKYAYVNVQRAAKALEMQG